MLGIRQVSGIKDTARYAFTGMDQNQSALNLEKCKSKPQWGTTSHRSEWPSLKSLQIGPPLVVQWLRICLPMQGMQVQALVRELRSHMPWSNWARVPRLLSLSSRACKPQLQSPSATTTEACVPRAHAPQQEKPPQWEAHTPQQRVSPAHRN